MRGTLLFRGKAAEYAKYRVDYPEAVMSEALDRIGVTRDDVVADLGSGPGMLTRWFLERGARGFGVEPDEGMGQVAEEGLRRFGPSFTCVEGTAERTSLGEASVSVVTVGNAFHYFDPSAARTEAKRILKPDGRVLIVGHDSVSSPNGFMQGVLRLRCEPRGARRPLLPPA
jgi:ubiquinone/menaquinone biosynthesis C-methylase UbiE